MDVGSPGLSFRSSFAVGAHAVKAKRQRLRNALGHETTRVLAYALSGVAANLARLLRRHHGRRRSALTRRGETGMSHRHVYRLLCRAFSTAILSPRDDVAHAAKQRDALAFLLAAANVPSGLRLSGIPASVASNR